MTTGKSPPSPERRVAGKGEIALASVLLGGVLALGYGYVRHDTVSLLAGLAAIVVGALTGIMRIIARGDR